MLKEILVELRKKAGLSQDELARLARVSKDHIAKMEQGRRIAPRKRTLIKIINALNPNQEDRHRFLSAAGYSLSPYESPVSYSPFSGEEPGLGLPEKIEISGLKNPALKAVAEILSDPELPVETRKEIEKMVIIFAEWLSHKKKEEIYNK